MNEDIATIEAATPLARENELILEHMNRLARATAKALGQGDYHEVSLSAQAMQCLHSELRKSVTISPTEHLGFFPTHKACVELCARMAETARTADLTRVFSFAMSQLQGAEIALECLGIPYNVGWDSENCRHTSISVGTVTLNVYPESESE